jgi:hypothetical protein
LGRLGRKVSCNYNKDIKCLLLFNGKKRCIFEETTDKQGENGRVQVGVCALLPQSERERFLAAMKKEGYHNPKSWKT